MASYYSGATLSLEQIAQVAYQAGFRGDVLSQMVAIAMRESGGITGAHRTDSNRAALSGDRGLWQINHTAWDNQLIQAGVIKQASDLFDPATNARAALYVYKKQGMAAWAINGDPMRSTNLANASRAVQNAANTGLLGTDWNSGTTATGAGGGTGGSTTLPSDTRLVQNDYGLYAMYQLAPGVWVNYPIPGDGSVQYGGVPIERLSNAAFNQKYPNSVAGAVSGAETAAELKEIQTTYGSFGGFTADLMNQMFPPGDPRRNDPEILRIIATRAGRPDMTDAEFENLLRATQYYQQRTQGELEWNDLSEAERSTRRQDTAARMAQTWLAHVGSTIATNDPRIAQFLEDVSSGKMGFGQWTESFVKPRALQVPESPWNRQLRDEQEAQRQRPIDIENTVAQLRTQAQRWGVPIDEKSLLNYATQLNEKTMSDDDFNKLLKDQAKVLFPWKDYDTETIVAASPWIETYNRVMERQGSLQTTEIAQALTAGTDPWSFEQGLKRSSAWVNETKNGQDAMSGAVSRLGQMAGMAAT
jgi:hypothetical protein